MDFSDIGLPILEFTFEMGEESVVQFVEDFDKVFTFEARKNFWMAQ